MPKQSGLPRGVSISNGSYQASFKGKHLGSFRSAELASSVYEQALTDFYSLPPGESKKYSRNGRRYFEYSVDECYQDLVSQYSWYDNGNGYGYAVIGGRNTYLHDFLWKLSGKEKPKGVEIDHADRDKSNCRLSNLRLVTRSGNLHNRGTVNVRKRKDMKMWEARVKVNGVIRRKLFDTEQEARGWVIDIKQEAIHAYQL